MTCRELTELLMAYLSGELADSRRAAFEEHLEICDDCVAYLESYKATVELGCSAFDYDEERVPVDVPDELVEAIFKSRDDRR